jgi:hypothetical protein
MNVVVYFYGRWSEEFYIWRDHTPTQFYFLDNMKISTDIKSFLLVMKMQRKLFGAEAKLIYG